MDPSSKFSSILPRSGRGPQASCAPPGPSTSGRLPGVTPGPSWASPAMEGALQGRCVVCSSVRTAVWRLSGKPSPDRGQEGGQEEQRRVQLATCPGLQPGSPTLTATRFVTRAQGGCLQSPFRRVDCPSENSAVRPAVARSPDPSPLGAWAGRGCGEGSTALGVCLWRWRTALPEKSVLLLLLLLVNWVSATPASLGPREETRRQPPFMLPPARGTKRVSRHSAERACSPHPPVG